LLLVRPISETPCSLQSLFPARLQLAFGLRLRLRQPGCDPKFLAALARNQIFVHSADHFCLQNLQERPRFPQCISRMKPGLRRTSCSQADELAWLSPSLFSQAEAVKPQPMLNLPDSSDIGSFHRRSS
jgi:hypothetical protein